MIIRKTCWTPCGADGAALAAMMKTKIARKAVAANQAEILKDR
jgi:hypothetical protein